VVTNKGRYQASKVLLAIGRRGTPRKLGVLGEDRAKVVYRLTDPEQYRGQHVLVVGGGDAALEAAASLAEVADTEVSLSYRGAAFSRAKPANRDRVEQLAGAGRLQVLLESNVREIRSDVVDIATAEDTRSLPNDAVIVCAGGILPTPFLKQIGIAVETKYGSA
jgi:thioredoxin reductase